LLFVAPTCADATPVWLHPQIQGLLFLDEPALHLLVAPARSHANLFSKGLFYMRLHMQIQGLPFLDELALHHKRSNTPCSNTGSHTCLHPC
jgi:hypothetical protein